MKIKKLRREVMGKNTVKSNAKNGRKRKSKFKLLKRSMIGGLAFCMVLGALNEYKGTGRKRKEKVFGFVEDEEELLRKAAENAENSDFIDTIDSIDASEIVDSGEGLDIAKTVGGVIKFRCGSEEISAANCEWGFYYSPQDIPVNFYGFGRDSKLEEVGNGYAFSGSYEFYTEKIRDNFWYYSISD